MCSKGPVFLGVFFALFLTAGRTLAQLGGLGESAVSTGGATGGGPAVEYLAAWETDAVHPGSSARLALRFMLSEGWHVNAHTPLDEFLIGTLLSFEEQPNFQITQVVYPEAKLFSFQFSPDTKVAVYEREFFLGATVSIADGTPPGDYVLKGQLRYQACNDTQCAPPKNLSISVPVKVVPASQALLPQQEDILDKVNWESGTSLDAASAPRPPETPAPEVIAPGNAAGTPRFQDWKTLADSFEVVNRTAYVSTEDFLAFIKAAESGQATAGDSGLAHKSWWLIMGIVLGGGLLLNLTPCVLPLIPINIAIIGAGARAGSRTRGFLLGGAYGAGIALVYGALGLIVVLGLSNAFGAINATIWFNAGIALLFLVLALAMFDVVPIDFSKYQAKLGIRKNENGSFLIAFAMGAISALLAGACVAPVVISTIVFTQDQYARGNNAALLLPFLLGVGMALPWPFAGAGLSLLPKPGMWMVRVKQAFGVFMLGLTVYYGYHAAKMINEQYFVDRAAVEASAKAADEQGWLHSLEEGLAQAKAEHKPVLIDFWATWCKNCLVMNQTVLKDAEVLKALDGYVMIKYQAEDPAASPVKDVWEYYELIGLPTYVILHEKQ